MGIYRNESVKSLPEQVQENKDNIKEINEILENIDPEQVATILSDIQALKAGQVVQNTAIGSNTQNIGNNTTAINTEKTARESVVGVDAFGHTYLKTATANKQILIENDGFIALKSNDDNAVMLHPQGLVQLITTDAVVECNSNEGVKLQANASSENPYELVLKNTGDFEVKNGHVLKFDTAGAITIDGQPIGGGGGGSQLYLHNIYASRTNTFNICIQIISQSSTPFDATALYQYLQTNHPNGDYPLQASGGCVFGSASEPVVGVFYSNLNEMKCLTQQISGTTLHSSIVSILYITDKVITL